MNNFICENCGNLMEKPITKGENFLGVFMGRFSLDYFDYSVFLCKSFIRNYICHFISYFGFCKQTKKCMSELRQC